MYESWRICFQCWLEKAGPAYLVVHLLRKALSRITNLFSLKHQDRSNQKKNLGENFGSLTDPGQDQQKGSSQKQDTAFFQSF